MIRQTLYLCFPGNGTLRFITAYDDAEAVAILRKEHSDLKYVSLLRTPFIREYEPGWRHIAGSYLSYVPTNGEVNITEEGGAE